jgi:hypothetical protein
MSNHNTQAATASSFVPTDRSYEQARVQKISKLTDSDRKSLTRQLGYLPGNALEVVARVKDIFLDATEEAHMDASTLDEPLVVKLYPLVLREEADGKKSRRRRRRQEPTNGNRDSEASAGELLLEPFPTIFWVTHPRIKALVSKLELDQMGTECERILKEDLQKEQIVGPGDSIQYSSDAPASVAPASALASMRKAHLTYSIERRDLILSQDWEYIVQRKWESAFDASRGVAGIRNPASVKCLHAHVSHFWSGCKDNVVGMWVAERVTKMLQQE